MVRKNIQIKGIVQGVGFRPFIYNKAIQYNLKGQVMNTAGGVIIDVEGTTSQLEAFLADVTNNPPVLAKVSQMIVEDKKEAAYEKFEIIASRQENSREVLVPPDVALCDDCKKDIFDAKSRYYLYPFTNCTNCGPRFTIVKDLPYDRSQTTMRDFTMCNACHEEYKNPLERRFHAQPVACPRCGPEVTIVDRNGQKVDLDEGDVFKTFRNLIKDGKIIALKGLGGFHLACNGKDFKAIETLRTRKKRPAKPFAVMARNLEIVKRYCHLNDAEEKVLIGPIAPIIILDRYENLPENLAPGIGTLGVMVPYTPLHFLLFDDQIDFLVMTSGNISNLPLVKDNEEALAELKFIADYFLIHNRDIYNRCDDSLVRVVEGKTNYWRRSRGTVPQAIELPMKVKEGVVVLGSGSEMKNTFCLLKGSSAFMSQHLGELDCLEGVENYRESLTNFYQLIGVKPTFVGYDLHPNYQVSKFVQELPIPIKIPIQHHHAHLAACMAENGLNEKVIGAILDGTGYGLDGNIWGFEILSGDYCEFVRHGHLSYIPLPGGERAINNPWLTLSSYLINSFADGKEIAKKLLPEKKDEIEIAAKLIAHKINSPLSSGCGRLFDAVSALLGVCLASTYEGQAAIELGELVLPGIKEHYPFHQEFSSSNKMKQEFIFRPEGMFDHILSDVKKGRDKREIATKFHNTIIEMTVAGIVITAIKTKLKKVVLSGGTWQNLYLSLETTKILKEKGFQVYNHSKVPANDGGLALGQAMIAYWRWVNKCV